MVVLEERPCPLGCTGGDEKVVTGRDRLHSLPGEFSVVKCRSCGLMRTDPRPTQESIGFYYPDEYGPYQINSVNFHGQETEAGESIWKRTLIRILDTDSRKTPPLPPGRMLEIGCGPGSFLDRMARRGWQVVGLEFSAKAAQAARLFGYPVSCGALEDMDDPSEPYGLVVGWHVLEHLHEPLFTLQKLQQWTKPGGWLVISVPDASSWDFRVFRERWYGLDLPRHLFHYTPSTLSHLLARSRWSTRRLFWHRNPNNLLQSLRYCCLDLGWKGSADYLLDTVASRRHRYGHLFLARLLGALHASGRMTVWARRA